MEHQLCQYSQFANNILEPGWTALNLELMHRSFYIIFMHEHNLFFAGEVYLLKSAQEFIMNFLVLMVEQEIKKRL